MSWQVRISSWITAILRYLRRVLVPLVISWLLVGFVAGSNDPDDWTWWARLAALVLFLILIDHRKDKQ